MVAIVGVGETEFKRGHTRGIDSLCVEAGRRAIADSGLAPADIDGFITCIQQPPLDEIAVGVGARQRRYSAINAYVPGAGPTAALVEARFAIEAGLAENVLVTYGSPDLAARWPLRVSRERPAQGGSRNARGLLRPTSVLRCRGTALQA